MSNSTTKLLYCLLNSNILDDLYSDTDLFCTRCRFEQRRQWRRRTSRRGWSPGAWSRQPRPPRMRTRRTRRSFVRTENKNIHSSSNCKFFWNMFSLSLPNCSDKNQTKTQLNWLFEVILFPKILQDLLTQHRR